MSDMPAGEIARRLDRVRAEADRAHWGELIVYVEPARPENGRYLTGLKHVNGPILLFLDRDGELTAVASDREDCAALDATPSVADVSHRADLGVGDSAGAGSVPPFLVPPGSAARVGTAQLDRAPARVRDAYAPLLQGGADASDLLQRVRMVKSDWEQQQVRAGAAIADEAWAALLHMAEPGVTEVDVIAAAERELKRRGAEDNFMIAAFGGAEVRAMHPPQDRVLQPGDLLRTELSPNVNGYYAQICRTAVVGEPSETQRTVYEAFRDATEAGIAVLRAGVTIDAVARAENDVLREHGLGQYCTSEYTRVRGHGTGLHLDESPGLREGDMSTIPAGTTMVVHPNTYGGSVGYVALGDPVIVREDGVERLSTMSRSILIGGGIAR